MMQKINSANKDKDRKHKERGEEGDKKQMEDT